MYGWMEFGYGLLDLISSACLLVKRILPDGWLDGELRWGGIRRERKIFMAMVATL